MTSIHVGKNPGVPKQLASDTGLNDSDKTFTVPAGECWEVNGIYVQLVTTATVGNRRLRMEIRDENDNILWFKLWTPTQAASLTRHYFAGPDLPDDAAFDTDNRARIEIETRFVLRGGWDIRLFDSAAVDAAADDMTVRIVGNSVDQWPG